MSLTFFLRKRKLGLNQELKKSKHSGGTRLEGKKIKVQQGTKGLRTIVRENKMKSLSDEMKN